MTNQTDKSRWQTFVDLENDAWRISHLVGLCGFVEHAGINGRSHQVVGSGDGVNVTGEMEVELRQKRK